MRAPGRAYRTSRPVSAGRSSSGRRRACRRWRSAGRPLRYAPRRSFSRSRKRFYVLDIQMPQGQPTGLSLLRSLEQRHPASVFIFVTGDPGLATHEEFAERVVLGKPLDFAALRRAVAERASDFIN